MTLAIARLLETGTVENRETHDDEGSENGKGREQMH
jgi:hypothetical protein